MNTKNESGRAIAIIIAVYLVAKLLLNMILSGFNINLFELLITAAEAVVLFIGLVYTNYVVAALLVIVMLANLGNNIKNLGSNLIYLIEGIIDIICAVLLCAPACVREHFSMTSSDLKNGDGN